MQPLQFVGSDQQLLTTGQYQQILDEIITSVRKPLVGRLAMPIREHPWEISEIKYYQQTDMGKAAIAMAMIQPAGDIVGLTPKTKSIPVIYKDFTIFARDIAASQRTGVPLDTTLAADSARRVAEREEDVVWEGAEGFEGFKNLTGRQTDASAGAWSTVANAYTDIRDAIKDLEAEGYPAPYKLVIAPAQKADLRDVFGSTGIPVIEKVQELMGGAQNVLTSFFFANTTSAIMFAADKANMELLYSPIAIHSAQTHTGDWFFRVYEALIPWFKAGREKAVVEITGITV